MIPNRFATVFRPFRDRFATVSRLAYFDALVYVDAQCLKDEGYYLQIDSHMRFVEVSTKFIILNANLIILNTEYIICNTEFIMFDTLRDPHQRLTGQSRPIFRPILTFSLPNNLKHIAIPGMFNDLMI